MRKRSQAQAYLSQVEMIDCIIQNKLIEQQQWKDIALGVTANMDGEKVQSSGAKNKMESAVIKCVDMEREINDLIDSLVDTKKSVLKTIESLDSPMEYNLLHKRYIQYWSLQQIADHYKRDYGWVTTTHGRALAHVQEIMDRSYSPACEDAKTMNIRLAGDKAIKNYDGTTAGTLQEILDREKRES